MPLYDIIRGISYPDPASVPDPGDIQGELHHVAGEVAVDLAAAGESAIDEWLRIGAIVEVPEALTAPKKIQGRKATSGGG